MKIKQFIRGLTSPFIFTKRNERGFLIIESIVTFVSLAFIITVLVMSYSNVSPAKTTFQLSQNLQIREYTKLYSVIAPDIAKTLDIGESVTFVIDSPNYLVNNGNKYLNLFENYKVTSEEKLREGLTSPLEIYNTLHNMSDVIITRSGINTYSCRVKYYYYDYKDIKQFKYDLDTKTVKNINDRSYAVFTRGIEHEYEFSMNGEIVKQSLKN